MEFYYVETYSENESMISEKEIVKIDINDINSIALIGASLEPALPAITIINAHVDSLSNYFLENPDHRLKKIYNYLNGDYMNGIRILTSATALALYEREFRSNGINDQDKIEKYNEWVKEHCKTLEVNKMLYEKDYIKKTSKSL